MNTVHTIQPDGPFGEDDIKRINVLNAQYGLIMDFEPIPELMAQHALEP